MTRKMERIAELVGGGRIERGTGRYGLESEVLYDKVSGIIREKRFEPENGRQKAAIVLAYYRSKADDIKNVKGFAELYETLREDDGSLDTRLIQIKPEDVIDGAPLPESVESVEIIDRRDRKGTLRGRHFLVYTKEQDSPTRGRIIGETVTIGYHRNGEVTREYEYRINGEYRGEYSSAHILPVGLEESLTKAAALKERRIKQALSKVKVKPKTRVRSLLEKCANYLPFGKDKTQG